MIWSGNLCSIWFMIFVFQVTSEQHYCHIYFDPFRNTFFSLILFVIVSLWFSMFSSFSYTPNKSAHFQESKTFLLYRFLYIRILGECWTQIKNSFDLDTFTFLLHVALQRRKGKNVSRILDVLPIYNHIYMTKPSI